MRFFIVMLICFSGRCLKRTRHGTDGFKPVAHYFPPKELWPNAAQEVLPTLLWLAFLGKNGSLWMVFPARYDHFIGALQRGVFSFHVTCLARKYMPFWHVFFFMVQVVSLRKGHGDDKDICSILEDAWTAERVKHFERKM